MHECVVYLRSLVASFFYCKINLYVQVEICSFALRTIES